MGRTSLVELWAMSYTDSKHHFGHLMSLSVSSPRRFSRVLACTGGEDDDRVDGQGRRQCDFRGRHLHRAATDLHGAARKHHYHLSLSFFEGSAVTACGRCRGRRREVTGG